MGISGGRCAVRRGTGAHRLYEADAGTHPRLVEFAGGGASVPLTGFGNLLAEGVRESVDEKGLLGVFMGGLTASSAGITAAMVFGVVCAAIFPPKQK